MKTAETSRERNKSPPLTGMKIQPSKQGEIGERTSHQTEINSRASLFQRAIVLYSRPPAFRCKSRPATVTVATTASAASSIHRRFSFVFLETNGSGVAEVDSRTYQDNQRPTVLRPEFLLVSTPARLFLERVPGGIGIGTALTCFRCVSQLFMYLMRGKWGRVWMSVAE